VQRAFGSRTNSTQRVQESASKDKKAKRADYINRLIRQPGVHTAIRERRNTMCAVSVKFTPNESTHGRHFDERATKHGPSTAVWSPRRPPLL
jgi:hypothetical protein